MLRSLILFILVPFICYSSIEIGFIGDSISSIHSFIKEEDTYPYLLEKELNQDGYYVVIRNFSVGGAPTAGGLDTIEYLYKCCSPQIVVIALGMNDFLAWYPLYSTENSLKALIKKCLDEGSIPVLGRMDMSSWVHHRGLDFTNNFNQLYLKLPVLYQIPSFDFINTEILINPYYNIGDRVHPNANGQKLICEELKQVLIPLLREIDEKKS